MTVYSIDIGYYLLIPTVWKAQIGRLNANAYIFAWVLISDPIIVLFFFAFCEYCSTCTWIWKLLQMPIANCDWGHIYNGNGTFCILFSLKKSEDSKIKSLMDIIQHEYIMKRVVGLYQASMFPYSWKIWFVGMGTSVGPQCFIYRDNCMLWHILPLSKKKQTKNCRSCDLYVTLSDISECPTIMFVI